MFVDNDDQLRQLYTVYLDNILNGAQILEHFSAVNAIDALKEDAKVDLILSEYKLKDGTGGDIYKYITENHLNIPFVLFSSNLPDMYEEFESFAQDNPKNGNILKPVSPAIFRESILKILAPSVVATHPVKAFQKVTLMSFLRFNKVLCDVYMKLSDRKYVKIINRNDVYTRKDIEKIREKNQEFLYIRNEDFERFSVSYTKTPFLIMEAEKMPDEAREEAVLTTHMMIHELVRKIGISEEVTKLAEKSVSEVMRLAEKDQTLHKLVCEMRDAKDYVYDHSYLTSIICCSISRKMDWNFENAVKKLCVASIFHDINIKNPELAMIQGLRDPRLQKFSKKDVEIYKRHPEETAKLLRQANIFPKDVANIVFEHHETIDGDGFPQMLHPGKLSSLVSIFIVAHEFVTGLYEIQFDTEKQKDLIERMQIKYNIGNFIPAIKALYQTLYEKD